MEHHRAQHQERLAIYQKIAQQYFQNPEKLPREIKFGYLTLRYGIRHETEWLAWCEEVLQFLG